MLPTHNKYVSKLYNNLRTLYNLIQYLCIISSLLSIFKIKYIKMYLYIYILSEWIIEYFCHYVFIRKIEKKYILNGAKTSAVL